MQEFIDQFHFLRPYWLLALLPAIALGVLLLRQKQRSSQWQQVIAPELLPHLLEGRLSKTGRWQFSGLIAGWVIACIALAGPSWQRLPQPVHQSEAAVVMLLDLSPSMMAEDVSPSRLQRTRYKLRDYLEQRVEGLTALVAYSGEAHVVSPLTDDTETIANLLPALNPTIMPLRGSNVEMGVDKALTLFEEAGVTQGEILLVTDGVASEAFPALRESLSDTPFRLSVLGVGSAEGAPIPRADGGFARDRRNDIVIAKLNNNELQQLSGELGGTYAGLTTDDSDIQHLLAHTERSELLNNQRRQVERDFDSWRDSGQWLALLLLPFAALAFRRGWLLTIGLVGFVGIMAPNKSYALEWRDLWLRSDQQGAIDLQEGRADEAASKFSSHDWQGSAHYRDENYPAAAEAFAQGDSPMDDYNRGNALAKAGELQKALEAYEQALEKQPEFADAEFNANLVRQLLDQQPQEQEQEQQAEQDPQQEEQQQEQEQQAQDQEGQEADQQNAQDSQQGQNPSQSENGQDAEQKGNKVNEEAASDLADRDGDSEQAEAEQAEAEQTEREAQAEAQEQSVQDSESQSPEQSEQNAPLMAESQSIEDAEQQQALEQWLRQVPDDPSGLLRRKFEYEHRRLRQRYRTGDWPPPETEATERW